MKMIGTFVDKNKDANLKILGVKLHNFKTGGGEEKPCSDLTIWPVKSVFGHSKM